MTDHERKALLICAALLAGVSGGGGFAGGRVTAPAPPQAEVREVVRYVPIPAPAVLAPMAEAPDAPVVVPVEPAASPPVVETKPLPPPVEMKRPKVEAKSPAKSAPKPRAPAPKRSSLPSCAVVEREYQRMSIAEKWAAYRKATPEQIAHGKRCLGM